MRTLLEIYFIAAAVAVVVGIMGLLYEPPEPPPIQCNYSHVDKDMRQPVDTRHAGFPHTLREGK